MSIVSGLTFLRILVSLQVTKLFGPLITAMFKMIVDIMQFCSIYILQLVAFSIFAAMAFIDVKEFGGIYETILLLFFATLGEFSFEIYDVYDDRIMMKYIAHLFMITFLFVNMILLLNMVIAMMSDTYIMMGC